MQNTDNQFDALLLEPRGDKVFRLQISRNTLIAIIFSLLIHAIILFFVVPKFEQEELAELPARELEVSLAPPTVEKKIAETPVEQPATPVEKIPEPTKPKPKVIVQKTEAPPKKPVFKVPDVLSTTKPSSEKTQPNLNIPQESAPTQPKPEEAPVDMMALVNQNRARRAAQESDAARINAEATARELGPSAEQRRDENIKRNFETGVNGVFEITNLETRTASFSFNGWTNDISNARREFFEVQAQSGQDVRLVMIKKMISLIRQHYKGDFNWESHRLNRTIVMSARPEDSAGLEEFMMIEFFGPNYKTQ
ncbi:MAG: hypothetical protein K2V71_02810 [Methylotenera sp.]|nr:hypothetical protein [Methylotenera sp.]